MNHTPAVSHIPSWCRSCRRWCPDSHFTTPTSQNGCGQSRVDLRYHPSMPRVGDVWVTTERVFILVDYVNPIAQCTERRQEMYVRAIFSEPMRLPCCAEKHKFVEFSRPVFFTQFLQDICPGLVSTYEDKTFEDTRHGFSLKNVKPPRKRSLRFLKDASYKCVPVSAPG